MSLRTKTALFAVVALLASLSLFYAGARLMMLRGSAALERDFALRELHHTRVTLQNELRHLGDHTTNWARLESIVRATEGEPFDLTATVFNGAIMAADHADLLAVYHRDGRRLLQWVPPRDSEFPEARNEVLPEHLPPDHPLLVRERRPGEMEALVGTDQGVFLVATHSIARHAGDGTPDGTLIAGHLIDTEILNTIKSHASGLVRFSPLAPGDQVSAERSIADAVAASGQPLFVTDDNDRLRVYDVLTDYRGTPVFLAEYHFPRTVYNLGRNAVAWLLGLLALVGALACAIAFAVVNRSVIGPLEELVAKVAQRRRQRDWLEPLEVDARHDGIGDLGREVAKLFASFNERTAALRSGYERLGDDLKNRHAKIAVLHENDVRFLELTERSDDGLFFTDHAGFFTYVNDAAARIVGLEPPEVIGRLFVEFVSPDWRERAVQYYRKIRAKRQLESTLEFKVLHATLGERWVRQTVVCHEKDGRVIGMRAIVRDIHETKALELTLKESTTKLDTILATIRSGILIVDAKDGVVREANSSALVLIGLPRSDVIGQPRDRFFLPRPLGAAAPDATQQHPGNRATLVTAKRRFLAIRLSVVPVTLNGRPHLVETFFDDTRSRTEQLRAAFRERLGLMVMRMSTRFLNLEPDELDGAINEELARLAKFLRMDRSYLSRLDIEPGAVLISHEWHAPNLSPVREIVRESLPVRQDAWWLQKLKRHEVLHFANPDDLPEADVIERSFLHDHGVVSLIAVPLLHRGKLLGTFGLHSRRHEMRWHEEIVGILRVAGDILAGAIARQPDSVVAAPFPPPTPDASVKLPRIPALLAEDDPAARKAATWAIERAGCRVETVDNGRDAVTRARQQGFDVIFLDVRLPELDGLEVAREIRRDPGACAPDVPLVAVTADDSAAVRRRCREAGMNHVLAKPLGVQDVRRVLGLDDNEDAKPAEAHPPIFDHDAVLERCDGNAELLRSVLTIFNENAEKYATDLEAAVAADDAKTVRLTAHACRGSAAYAGASRVVAIAAQLEADATDGDLSNAAASVEMLRREITRHGAVLAVQGVLDD